MALFAAIIFLAFFMQAAVAENFYVSKIGNNSDGLSWASAWNEMNQINWNSINPGDTIWLAAGTYTTSLSPRASGTTGNLIYIKRVLSTDTAPVNSPGWSSSFDSQVIIAPQNSSPIEWVDMANGSGSFIYIDGRIDSGIQAKIANVSDVYAGSVSFGYNSGNQNDITFANIDMAGPGGSTVFNSNIAIFNAYTWNGSGFSVLSNINVTDSRIHGGPNLIRLVRSNGVVFQHSKFYDNHAANSSDVHPNLFDMDGTKNTTFRYNDISDWSVEGFMFFNSGPSGFPLYVYGNIFHSPRHPNARVMWASKPEGAQDAAQGPIYFYNNTFVNVNVTATESRMMPFAPGSQARNNIYWNSNYYGITFSDIDYEFSNSTIP